MFRLTNAVSNQGNSVTSGARSRRVDRLAERLEQGAAALRSVATALSDAEWQTRIPGDGRTVGVIVRHVATMYPLEDHAVRHSYHHAARIRAALGTAIT